MTLDPAMAKTIDLLTRPPQQIASGLEPMGAAGPTRRFSVFIGADLALATALTERWMKVTAQKGDAGLDEVLDDAEQEMATRDSDLVKHALLMFITHDPVGRQLPIPPLAEREPDLVVPSQRALNQPPAGIEALGGTGKEAALDYFREDTLFNEHHTKWHVVYPGSGLNGVLRDRQGELFWYMHQQMLARYDAERSAVGLPAVVPLDKFDQPMEEGYDAEIPGRASRPDHADWPMVPLDDVNGPYGPAHQAERRDRLLAAATSGKLQHPTSGGTIDIKGVEILASTVEATIGSAIGSDWEPWSFYGSYHNIGHGLIAMAGEPGQGVMGNPASAVRDPIFYRWHRHIDDIVDTWWRTQPAHDLAKTDPGVRAHEIAVIAKRSVPPGVDGQAWAEATFGGASWGQPVPGVVLDALGTHMGHEKVKVPGGGTIDKPYLDHEDFSWLLRYENPGPTDVELTFRVFLVPDAVATTDRRAWIEMDKFTDTVPAGARQVMLRSARESAVVRKPARRPGEQSTPHPPGVDRNYCDCGWPYHLLLPRGTTAGQTFRILVLLTRDKVVEEKKHKCGSLSFCGARDAAYPDPQEMGYPFNRPIDLAALLQRPNVASRTITIKHQP